MDTNVQRALNDKLYDKRKVGALESVSLPPPLFLSYLRISESLNLYQT